LAVADGEGMDACNRCVRNGEFGPPVAREEGASGEGHEVIGALGVAGGIHGNGAQCASMGRVGWVGIIEDLGVAAKLDAHGGKIGTGLAGHDGSWAHGCGDAV
jgi:hypothetical protein